MRHPAPPPRDRTARIAVSALFFVNGAGFASILPRLPAIKESLDLSNAELGLAIAAMPVGGLLAGGLVGFFIARFGSGRTAAAAGTATALLVAAVGLAPTWVLLALAYLVFGAFDATMDASMNAHGLGVQRLYGRSILQGFHGLWSAGSMVGGAVGAAAALAGVPVQVQVVLVAPVLAVTVLIASRGLLPARMADAHAPGDAAEEHIHVRNAPRLLRVLGPIAMLGILCVVLQGTAATWSAVFLTDVLQLSAGFAAMAFVVYMAAMTVGRLTNDRWVDRFGGVPVVRAGALIGAGGVALVIVSGASGLALAAFIGFAAIGIGSSGLFPIMIAAAGSRPGIPAGHGVALTSWFVRIGLMVAPAAVGITADATGLGTAFVIPLVAALAIAALAVPLTGGRSHRASGPALPRAG
ncbi:MAG: MFS transporter [Chloroflexi bacterium]|nr:MFS transporter [Chloroflexota bacterium]